MKALLRLVASIFLLPMGSSALAVPTYFSFEGIIIQDTEFYGDLLTANGLTDGTVIAYTFLIDYDREAITPENQWVDKTVQYDGRPGPNVTNYFYSEFISGTAIYKIESPTAWHGSGESNGYIWDNSYYEATWFHAIADGFALSLVTGPRFGVTSDELLFNEITIGSTWFVREDARNQDTGEWSRFQGSVTLTSITPTPEPSTLAILVVGLVGLGFGRRKKLQ